MSARDQRSRRRMGIGLGIAGAVLIAAIAGVGITVWRGGTSVPSGEELLTQSDEVRAELKESIHGVALLIDPSAPYESPDEGDNDRVQLFEERLDLVECETSGGGYAYTLDRSIGNVDGWRFPESQEEFRQHVAEQLHAAGWQDVTGTSYDGDVDTTVVYARYPEVVDKLTIMFHPGAEADGVSISAQGSCHPGDVREVRDLRRERAGN